MNQSNLFKVTTLFLCANFLCPTLSMANDIIPSPHTQDGVNLALEVSQEIKRLNKERGFLDNNDFQIREAFKTIQTYLGNGKTTEPIKQELLEKYLHLAFKNQKTWLAWFVKNAYEKLGMLDKAKNANFFLKGLITQDKILQEIAEEAVAQKHGITVDELRKQIPQA